MYYIPSNEIYKSAVIFSRDLLYALSHRQDSTYHSLCYTSGGELAGTREREREREREVNGIMRD